MVRRYIPGVDDEDDAVAQGLVESWSDDGDDDEVAYVTAPPSLEREAEGYAAGLEASTGVAHHVVIRSDCPPGKMYVTDTPFASLT